MTTQPLTPNQITAIPAGTRIQATLATTELDGYPSTRQITIVIDRAPKLWAHRPGQALLFRKSWDMVAVVPSTVRILDHA